jgi:hypothetical protein
MVLRTLHEQAVEYNEPLYVAQIDIWKAFDSVSWPLLFQKLYALGIHGPLIEMLQLAYDGQTVFVKANKRYSDTIHTTIGTP